MHAMYLSTHGGRVCIHAVLCVHSLAPTIYGIRRMENTVGASAREVCQRVGVVLYVDHCGGECKRGVCKSRTIVGASTSEVCARVGPLWGEYERGVCKSRMIAGLGWSAGSSVRRTV